MVRTSRKSSPTRAVLLGRRRLDERRAEAAARLERGVEARGDVRVELDLADPGRDGDAHAFEARRGIRRGEGVERGLGTPAVGAGHRVGAGERSRRSSAPSGLRGRGSSESGTTPASETSPRVGLIAEVPQHAEGIRSEPAVSVPVAAGVMRAASAAAEPPLDPPGDRVEVPRAADLVGRPADRELVRVQVAEQHHARGGQLGPGVAVLRRHLLEEPARGGHRLAGDAVEVLEPDRHARQRRGRPVTAHSGVAQALVGTRGGLERVLLVDAHPGVDRAWVAFVAADAVDFADPREKGCRHLAGREPASLELCRELHDAELRDVGHVPADSRKRRGLSTISSSICACVTPRARSCGRIVLERCR